jgi:hypothetical protein
VAAKKTMTEAEKAAERAKATAVQQPAAWKRPGQSASLGKPHGFGFGPEPPPRTSTEMAKRASHTAQPRSAFGGTVTYPIAMPPLTAATAKVHSADENQVGANNGGGIYRWPEFDSWAGVNRLQPYPRLAHASYSLRKATTPKKTRFR